MRSGSREDLRVLFDEGGVMDQSAGYVLGPSEGEAYWFSGTLMVTKADSAQSGGFLSFLDQTAPPGSATPRHIHDEDEAFYVLEGELTFFCGGKTLHATTGSFVFAPKGIEHSFKVGPEGARLLTLGGPKFADFVAAAGDPAPSLTVPPPAGPPDAEQLAALAARFGIQITGPPPD